MHAYAIHFPVGLQKYKKAEKSLYYQGKSAFFLMSAIRPQVRNPLRSGAFGVPPMFFLMSHRKNARSNASNALRSKSPETKKAAVLSAALKIL